MGRQSFAQELFLEVTFTVLVCDFAEVGEKKRTFETWWMSVVSCKPCITGSLPPALNPPHSSSCENWNKDAATVLYSSRKHTFWSSSRKLFSAVLRRGREWQAALTPAHPKRFVSSLNQQSQDFLEGRTRSEKNSELVIESRKSICLCQITYMSVLNMLKLWHKGLVEHFLKILFRLHESKLRVPQYKKKFKYLSLRNYTEKLNQEREGGMKRRGDKRNCKKP